MRSLVLAIAVALVAGSVALLSGPGAIAAGTWTNVTPAGVNLSTDPGCGNFGTQSVVVDPARPATLYAEFNCQGIWKSTDYGQTWAQNPMNSVAYNCAGGISIGLGAAGGPPKIYEACIRGATGFWSSTDGGTNWTQYNVVPLASGRQDVYPPTVDPYDPSHLLMAGHEQNVIVQSTNGGQNWTNIPMASGMNENGGTAFLWFIDTGSSATTRNTWLYMAQGTGGVVGTWRTSNGGASWQRVESNEHPHGNAQIYQTSPGGALYMAGVYGTQGWGVYRSTDLGQTWTHQGNGSSEAIVFGTPNNVYAAFGWACGFGCNVDPSIQAAPQPGTSWTSVARPSGMGQGPAEAAITFDGSSYIVVTANWGAGLWRYVETPGVGPTATPTPTATLAATPTATPQATSTSTPTPSPTSTPPTATVTALATSTSVPTDTPPPTATPETCYALYIHNGQPQQYTRPLAECINQ